jgi:uncharacterized protein (TIGR00255 family)
MTAPLASMTGFARTEGSFGEGVAEGAPTSSPGAITWAWELRSVNGRGLDLKFRLPPGCDALEPALRAQASAVLRRGNVTANLSLQRAAAGARLTVDEAALRQVTEAAIALHARLAARLPETPPPRADALLALPGVLSRSAAETDTLDAAMAAVLADGFASALDQLAAGRRAEGARLSALLTGMLGEIAALRAQAESEAAGQPAAHRARLMDNLQALLRDGPGLPEERIAQEVALLASRSDVREELDRLDSHVAAAHALLAEGAHIGRRLDFLVQEFNREANTLCAKSASSALTATGLRLKAAIEQLREQVQNIE